MAKTRAELEAETEARRKVFAYLEGWRHAAGSMAIPTDGSASDPDWLAGWTAGKVAKSAAKRHAEQTYGYTLAIFRPA